MPDNPPVILIDTNVWLDAYLPHRTGRQEAFGLLKEAVNQDTSLVFASQAALDVYQQVMADNKRWVRSQGILTDAIALAIKRHAWDCVNEMRQIAVAVPADASDFFLAAKLRDLHDDLEDDLAMVACQRAKANYLVTNDRALLAHSPTDARTPAQMLELLRAGLAKGTSGTNAQDDGSWLRRWVKSQEQAAEPTN